MDSEQNNISTSEKKSSESIEEKKPSKVADIFLGEMRKYTRSQVIAINAILCAFIIVFAIFPVSIGILQLAVLQIIAILISVELLGLLNGMLSGLFFGFVSFTTALLRPGVLSPLFIRNPLITFFPRVMIAVVVFFFIKFMDFLFAKIKYKTDKSAKITPKILDTIKYAVGSFLGVATNTAGVLGFMYLFYGNDPTAAGVAITPAFIGGIIVSNSLIEAAVCTVLTPAIVIAVKKTLEYSMRKKMK